SVWSEQSVHFSRGDLEREVLERHDLELLFSVLLGSRGESKAARGRRQGRRRIVDLTKLFCADADGHAGAGKDNRGLERNALDQTPESEGRLLCLERVLDDVSDRYASAVASEEGEPRPSLLRLRQDLHSAFMSQVVLRQSGLIACHANDPRFLSDSKCGIQVARRNRGENRVRERGRFGIAHAADEDGQENLTLGRPLGKEAGSVKRSENAPSVLRRDEMTEAVGRPDKRGGGPGKMQDRERRMWNRRKRSRRRGREAFDQTSSWSGGCGDDDAGRRQFLIHRPDRPGIAEPNQLHRG